MADKEAKGLCMFCAELFTPGHLLKHSRFKLLVMEMEEEEPECEEEEAVDGNELGDCGNTHKILDLDLAKKLSGKLEIITPLTIHVVGGKLIETPLICKRLVGQLQQQPKFTSELIVLPLKCCDLVLGAPWLSVITPIKWNLLKLAMKFFREGDISVWKISKNSSRNLINNMSSIQPKFFHENFDTMGLQETPLRGTYADDCEHTSCIIFVVITLYVASSHKALLDYGKITVKGKAQMELVTLAYAGPQMISELLKRRKDMSFYGEMVAAWANATHEWSMKHPLGEELEHNVGNEMMFSYCAYGLLCLHSGTSIEVFDEKVYGPYTVRDIIGAATSQFELPPKLVISLMFSVFQLKLCTEPLFYLCPPSTTTSVASSKRG